MHRREIPGYYASLHSLFVFTPPYRSAIVNNRGGDSECCLDATTCDSQTTLTIMHMIVPPTLFSLYFNFMMFENSHIVR